jgi:antitoxin component YwqK of YwqJK toxin-antitoxin module
MINDSFPNSKGKVFEFYGNGFLKAKGAMKASELHGYWEWFRKDGTIMRSGNFKNGQNVGEWITYDSSGKVYKVTQK